MNFLRCARHIINGSMLMIGLTTAAIQPAKAADTQVNTYTSWWQHNPDVASNPAGNFVVTWQSDDQDGNGNGIFARRYTSAGVAQGSEFQVNTTTLYGQQNPAIAMDHSGRFVICWFDSSGSDAIRAQRFNADGTKNGSEFRVNTPRFGFFLSSPDIAMSSSGQFVIVWQGRSHYAGSNNDIYGQRFNADASPLGGEFQVNSTTSEDQHNPSVAIADSGQFVVAWTHSPLRDDGYWAGSFFVRTQLFDAAGSPIGSEYSISDSPGYEQTFPAVAIHGTGNYLVSWTGARMGADPNNADIDVYVQPFSAAGTALGNELRVNSTLAGNQLSHSIAINANGEFVVAWSGAEPVVPPADPYNPFYDAYLQRFNASGARLGSETRLNSYTTNTQFLPSVALDSDGNTFATWSSWGQDGSGYGVYLTRIQGNRSPVAVNDTATLGEDTSEALAVLANDSDPDGDSLTITAVSAAANGTTSITSDDAGTSGILYTPNANYYGPDSFTYTISDGNGKTATATVDVTVEPVNDKPVAAGQELSTDEDVPLNLTLGASDDDKDTLTYTVTQAPSNGTLSGSGANLVYTPTANFNGSDSFAFTANDGDTDSNTATVKITVAPVNDAPKAVADSIETERNTTVTIPVIANDTDIDGDALTVSSVTQPKKGNVTIAGGVVTYEPKRNFHGSETFSYTISDGKGGTATATVTVTVAKK